MTENQYLLNIINKYIASQISDIILRNTLQGLLLEIQQWANIYLLDIYISGSRAKGTAIKGNSDIDFLISYPQRPLVHYVKFMILFIVGLIQKDIKYETKCFLGHSILWI